MNSSVDKKIENIVDAIWNDVTEQHSDASLKGHAKLDKETIIQIINDIQVVLLPGYMGSRKGQTASAMKYEIGINIEKVYSALSGQITRALRFHPDYEELDFGERKEKGRELAEKFLDEVVNIRELLKTDLQAAYDGDPAAYNLDEIVYSYPGFYAIMVARVAHVLYNLGIPLIPRIMTEYAHSATGIDIHPGATIGKYFFIDHGTGIVIGETTVIGERVKIYQGVTLGGLSTRGGQSLKGKRRHPTIGNDVTIYSNASILGGDTVIGDGCVIGGNCFITASVPAHSKVNNQTPKPEIRSGSAIEE